MVSIFGEAVFGDFSRGLFGEGKVPPESVARNVLSIGTSLPLSKAGIKAAFRFHMKLLRPDLSDSAADELRLAHLSDVKTSKTERLAELLWARDDLLSRVKEPVTGSGVPPANFNSRYKREPCKRCDDERRTSRGEPFRQCKRRSRRSRWAGYCWPCARDAENEAKREQRRQARADRSCASCGGLFTPARSDGLYCSSACRQREHRRKAAS